MPIQSSIETLSPASDLSGLASRRSMRARHVDLVSSLLMAVLVMSACCVLVMLTIWLTGTELIPQLERPSPTTRLTSASSAASVYEFEMPATEEIVALKEPSLQQVVQQVDSVDLASLAAGASDELGQGSSAAGQSTAGQSGHDGPSDWDSAGDDLVPRFQRWHLVFQAPSQTVYARQLDALNIELGAFGGDLPGIDVASNLSSTIHHRHNDQPKTEQRLYFSWAIPTASTIRLAGFERRLLSQAGVAVAGRQIVKFLPVELENQLAIMELDYARSRGVDSVAQIARTVFHCQSDGADYRFVVTGQRYRDW